MLGSILALQCRNSQYEVTTRTNASGDQLSDSMACGPDPATNGREPLRHVPRHTLGSRSMTPRSSRKSAFTSITSTPHTLPVPVDKVAVAAAAGAAAFSRSSDLTATFSHDLPLVKLSCS